MTKSVLPQQAEALKRMELCSVRGALLRLGHIICLDPVRIQENAFQQGYLLTGHA